MESGVIRDANDAHRQLSDAEMLALHDKATSRGGTKPRKPRASKAKLVAETPGADKAGRKPTDEVAESPGIAPEFTEEGLALAFAEKYQDRLRWMEEWSCWMEWTGTHWRRVKTLAVYELVRRICRDAAHRVDTSTASGQRLAADLNTAKKRAAVQSIARSDLRFAAVAEQWDADDWLLGTPGGIVDLRTGKNVRFDSKKYITQITAVAPNPNCAIPIWLDFLGKVTMGDRNLQAYLRRLFGYCLTGSTREQNLPFVYGPGGNGKGTLLNVLIGILGELHKAADVETFAERKHQAHSTEIARLHKARVVTSEETEKGQFWAEARLKKMTGGNTLTARFMRCDDFEFVPKFKLIIVGNHKPKFRSVDEAIRRRLHLIPFDYKVPKEQKDFHLGDKLKAEYPGILAWIIEGCLQWQQKGLDAPESVLTATNDYLNDEDIIGQWLANRCTVDGFSKTNLKELFESWKHYAELTGIKNVGISKDLATELEKRLGEGSKKTVMGICRFNGIRLKTPEESRADACTEGAEYPAAEDAI
jgi:putative DNA primase/helicase